MFGIIAIINNIQYILLALFSPVLQSRGFLCETIKISPLGIPFKNSAKGYSNAYSLTKEIFGSLLRYSCK